MLRPEDPLAPRGPAFSEGWHAQVLALADGLIQAGYFTPDMWAQALGAALKQAEMSGAPDTEETYYRSALSALEALSNQETGISSKDLAERKSAWEEAYRRTPHGRPVTL